jgi:hypothetical protein
MKMVESYAVKNPMDSSVKVGEGELTPQLSAAYPGIPWIVPYFIFSTFPSMFGHFVCEEFARAAFDFLNIHMTDALISDLVGSFLFQNLLFRDRLHDLFLGLCYDHGPEDLHHIFFQAFTGAITYLSKWQVDAVVKLRRVNEMAAITGLFDLCLCQAVRLWEFSPVFGTLDILLKRKQPAKPVAKYEDVQYENRLLTVLQRAKNDRTYARMFLDAFETTSTSVLPNASSIFFYGGVFFPITVVDLTLAQRLLMKDRAPAGRPAEAATDAFRVRMRASYYPQATLQWPKPTEIGDEFTLKKLLECQELHNFLHKIAGGLKWFDLVGRSARNLMPLHCHALVNHRLTLNPKLPSAEFPSDQALLFSIRQFEVYARANVSDAIRKAVRDYRKYIETELSKRIAARRTTPLAESVYLAAGDLVKEWREKIGQPVAMAPPSADQDIPLAEYFLSAADALADAYFQQKVSRVHWGISNPGFSPTEYRQERQRSVDHFLKFNAADPVPGTLLDFAGDPVVRRTLANTGLIAGLLTNAEEALRETFEAEFDAYRFGTVLDLLLDMHASLSPLLGAEEFMGDAATQRALLAAVCEGQGLPYVSWNILRAIALIEAVEAGQVPELAGLEKIGKGILDRLKAPIGEMRGWFGLRNGRLKLPLLGVM